MPAITRVEVTATGPTMPEVRFTDALPPVFTTVTIVEIEDESGLTGVGAIESDSFGAFDLGPLETLRSLAPGVIGRDSSRPAELRALLESRLPSASRMVPAAAIEIACWDLLARHDELPLHRLLGGAREEMSAYASLPFESDRSTLLELVAAVTSDGYRAIKLHLSGDPDPDVSSTAAVREAFPGLEIMVDAESVYDRRGAGLVGRALDQLDIRWFEAPLPDRDVEGYAALRQSLATPVIPAGGLVSDLRELAQILSARPWSAVRTQTMEGGVGYIRDVAALARSFGLDLELTSYGTTLTRAIDLQLMLGLGLGSYFEQPFPIEPWEFGTTGPLPVVDGTAKAPDGPGLGVSLDRSAVEAATLARFAQGVHHTP